MPERAAFLPDSGTLLVADLHIGKPAHFRRFGAAIPSGSTEDTLNRLASLATTLDANHLVVLGDFWHSAQGMSETRSAVVARWLSTLPCGLTLVEGNHDRRVQSDGIGLRRMGSTEIDGFRLLHHPEDSPEGCCIAGHLHPAVSVCLGSRESVRLRCFWIRRDVLVLPAFGAFTGAWTIERVPGDRVLAIADRQLLEIPEAITNRP